MYSRTVTQSQVLAAQAVIDRRPKAARYDLRSHYSTIANVARLVKHFDGLLDETGELDKRVRPKGLFPQEREWIEAQRILCKLDFVYYATRYAYIKSTLGDTGERIIRWSPNKAQEVDLAIWAEHEENFWPIIELKLKARQLGETTLWQIALAHRVQFYRDITALVGSSDPEKSRKMASDKMGRVIDMQPWWLGPKVERFKSGELFCNIPEMGSAVTVQHGTQRSGLGRGDTIDIFHLSEPAEYHDAYELIDASLLIAVHDNPMTLGCVEGTAKGDTGWVSDTWDTATRLWPVRMSRFRPHFNPWFIGTDVWPTATWLHLHSVPPNWKPDELTEGHARNAAAYVAQVPVLTKVLGAEWAMPLAQQWYWEASRKEAEAKDTIEKFYEELPATPEEAFQATGYSIFSPQVLHQITNLKKPLALYQGRPAVFAITGHEIDREFDPLPSQIDRDRRPVELRSDLAFSLPTLRFTLVPLKFDGFVSQHEMNRLYVWELPDGRNDYGAGVDLSDGIGKDRSTCEMLRKGTVGRPAEQVAEFTSDQLNIIEFAPFVLAIGLYYSQNRSGPSAFSQPQIAIETNRAGYATQDQLRKWGWSNFPTNRGARDQRVPTQRNRIGWVTTGWNRDEIIAKPAKYIKSGDLRVNSPWLIQEMKTLKRGEDSTRIEASAGHYDDRYFGMGIGFICLHIDTDLYRNEKSTWETRLDEAEAEQGAALATRQPDLQSWRILPVPDDAQTPLPAQAIDLADWSTERFR